MEVPQPIQTASLKLVRVPRLRASPRHGGAEGIFEVANLTRVISQIWLPVSCEGKFSIKWRIAEWGSRGRSPWAASPSGGEGGSPSYFIEN